MAKVKATSRLRGRSANSLWIGVYNSILLLCLPLIALILLKKWLRKPGYKKHFLQRLGVYDCKRLPACIHLHGVSVGECAAIAKLIPELRKQHPHLPIVFTCTTVAGSNYIERNWGEQVIHTYLPLDFQLTVGAFLTHFNPVLTMSVEMEWWPNLIRQSRNQGSRVVLVNARMTDRSKNRYAKMLGLFTFMVSKVHKILPQSELSYQAFRELGVPPEKLMTCGNIKYDWPELKHADPTQKPSHLTWIAGSTHDTEELAVVAAHKQLLQQNPAAQLIIAPRHPERFDEVWRLLQASGLSCQRYSHAPTLTANTQVYLLDTMGKLFTFYRDAHVAFIGGSLVKLGGHNPAEAIVQGAAVVIGSSRRNCEDICAPLSQVGALVEGNEPQQIAKEVIGFWQNCAATVQQIQAGQATIAKHNGAVHKTTLQVLYQLKQAQRPVHSTRLHPMVIR
ncbi:3-deoxy-D-manno-octulosonic acid transferase [Pseudoalteromonas piscicida]|uniref:3-deoxy-D-manno-octulosonic acid transferase n=1 Tax=Pseudoalteromonas piscicida TaxID=43662 RepID=UPI0032C1DF0B